MFIDTAKIIVIAGPGGNGVNSFYRDLITPKGHPDGGDGGDGGNVIIRVSTHVHTLIDFKYRPIIKATKGGHGSGKQKRGRNGKDAILEVPAGTLVCDANTKMVLRDLVNEGDELLVAKGGIGGRGNRSRKDAIPGEEGEEKQLFLELKIIADAGIIGLPNAGKSTLLSRISRAHPRIAGFPFTTKSPVLGVVEYGDEKTFRAAEIPGLIEDSHKGRGLGDKFLRHAERTRIFVHLLDVSKPSADEVLADYKKINKELRLYKKDLGSKPQVIVANKLDIEGAAENLKAVSHEIGEDIISISAKDGVGIEKLIEAIAIKLQDSL
ncbi:MAG: Obg family GTPase CgtA [Candidatus Omnitrophica bacterium]|nr:Obg family GTPase CgtA [Candidatus Omnitrophota bacterium]